MTRETEKKNKSTNTFSILSISKFMQKLSISTPT